MIISHHPDDATLMSFAAGGLAEALSVVVATHLVVCRRCRNEVRLMERIGATLLGALDASPVGSAGVVWSEPHTPPLPPAEPLVTIGAESDVPPPLSDLVGSSLSAVRWKWLLPGVSRHEIALSPGKPGYLVLLRADPGGVIPQHGHGGSELTLVLQGAYADETGRYERGDCADLDADVEHRPVADAVMGCICVVASETKPRLTGTLGRLVQPLIGR
jgi:putative transcriptional regulator